VRYVAHNGPPMTDRRLILRATRRRLKPGYAFGKWNAQLNAHNVFDQHYFINSYQFLAFATWLVILQISRCQSGETSSQATDAESSRCLHIGIL